MNPTNALEPIDKMTHPNKEERDHHHQSQLIMQDEIIKTTVSVDQLHH